MGMIIEGLRRIVSEAKLSRHAEGIGFAMSDFTKDTTVSGLADDLNQLIGIDWMKSVSGLSNISRGFEFYSEDSDLDVAVTEFTTWHKVPEQCSTYRVREISW